MVVQLSSGPVGAHTEERMFLMDITLFVSVLAFALLPFCIPIHSYN